MKEYERNEIRRMQDIIVRSYGLESPITIEFFRLCEKARYETIHRAFIYFTEHYEAEAEEE